LEHIPLDTVNGQLVMVCRELALEGFYEINMSTRMNRRNFSFIEGRK
jgi:hypothetical protein